MHSCTTNVNRGRIAQKAPVTGVRQGWQGRRRHEYNNNNNVVRQDTSNLDLDVVTDKLLDRGPQKRPHLIAHDILHADEHY